MLYRLGKRQDFLEFIREKEWYCFGAGVRLSEIGEIYKAYTTIHAPAGIVDNDTAKQGQSVYIIGMDRPVISFERFLKIVLPGDVILITIKYFAEWIRKLEQVKELENVYCFIESMIREEEEEMDCYAEKMPELQKTDREIIPKKIHYCWFGGKEIPDTHQRWMESWKRFCPEYEIVRWDESNYDIRKNGYMKSAYEAGKWAFVSDYARLDVVCRYGGIYLDTDVELLKPLDYFLKDEGFCGFERNKTVNFGIGFGAIKNNPILQDLLLLYENLQWDGGIHLCTVFQTGVLRKYGLNECNSYQEVPHMTVYPVSVFCGKSVFTNRCFISNDTYAVHHFAASWVEDSTEFMVARKIRKKHQDKILLINNRKDKGMRNE